MKKPLFFMFFILNVLSGMAQNLSSDRRTSSNSRSLPLQQFAFSVTTLTAGTPSWGLNYSGSYGVRTSGAFGYDGIDQQITLKGYLGKRFTIFANAALGFTHDGQTNSAQQVELIRDLIGGNKPLGPRLGLSLGTGRDWVNVKSIFSRLTMAYDAANWRMGGNLRFEKAFESSRDKMDFITSVGIHHKIGGPVFAGLEAVGQDLEGFWDKEEAEGGAKLLLGPSINIAKPNSKFAFSACGGPVFYGSRNAITPSSALRDLNTDNGYTIRAMVSLNLR